jgi:hypothetical protein
LNSWPRGGNVVDGGDFSDFRATGVSVNVPTSPAPIDPPIGSTWYVGSAFLFAPVLVVLSPWPALTAVLWAIIGLTGLWLGVLGVAMATGLAVVLRSNAEIPEDYWWSILDHRPPKAPEDSGPGATRRWKSRAQPTAVG